VHRALSVIEAIGWISSLVLLATLVKQIAKQWREGTKGVSKWLFVGQVAASFGFVVYSAFQHNRVFVVTNSLILLSAIVGVVIWWRSSRTEVQRGVRAPIGNDAHARGPRPRESSRAGARRGEA
jgi:MtN3 and saliva related transmembrane protein